MTSIYRCDDLTEEIFGHLCNVALTKCNDKFERKKAGCGGMAMRKRVLIKNFVSSLFKIHKKPPGSPTSSDEQPMVSDDEDDEEEGDEEFEDYEMDMSESDNPVNHHSYYDEEMEVHVEDLSHNNFSNGDCWLSQANMYRQEQPNYYEYPSTSYSIYDVYSTVSEQANIGEIPSPSDPLASISSIMQPSPVYTDMYQFPTNASTTTTATSVDDYFMNAEYSQTMEETHELTDLDAATGESNRMKRRINEGFDDFSSQFNHLKRIKIEKLQISRIFWILIFLFVLGMFIYELYTIIANYFSHPVTVNTEIFFEQLSFPVVSFCNMNPYKYSVVKSNSAFSTLNNLMTVYTSAVAGSYSTDAFGLYSTNNQSYDLDERTFDAQILAANQISASDKDAALYTYADMVQECTFAGSSCSSADFTRYVDPVYGACYSFNADKSLNFSVSRQGIQYGLKMIITVMQTTVAGDTDFLPTTKQAGARVGILPRGSLPGLDNNGIDVGVGYESAISIIYTQNIRAKRPYGTCVDRESTSTDYYQNYTYTLDTCFDGCEQRNTVKNCNCANPRLALGPNDVACQPNKTDLDCLQSLKGCQTNTTNPNIDLLTDCSCDPPCTEDTYSTTVSLAKFPPSSYYVAVADDSTVGSCSTSSSFSSQAACQSWYQTNGLVLQVFFSTLSYEVYTETSGYTVGDAINDLGGQAGLWLGLSVISCVEMAGFLLVMGGFAVQGHKVRIDPNDEDLEDDHRIKDVEDVRQELDHMERHHNEMEMDSGGEEEGGDEAIDDDDIDEEDDKKER